MGVRTRDGEKKAGEKEMMVRSLEEEDKRRKKMRKNIGPEAEKAVGTKGMAERKRRKVYRKGI